jgi:hypothetical protein
VSDPIHDASVAVLQQRRGELAYEAQMCALESLPLSASTKRELEALDAELRRRGVDLSSG